MRFESLNIAKYGKFRERTIDDLEPFTIVHGPNEAGKSTLRHLLRDLLFGFPVARTSHPYGFDGMDAKARVRLADGTRLTVHRKRSTSPFVDFPDSAITRDGWATLLGGLDEALYARMLCCSGQEMNGTAEALRKGEFLQTVHRDITGGLRDDKAFLEELVARLKEFRLGQGIQRKHKELDQFLAEVGQAGSNWSDLSSKTLELQMLERDHDHDRIRSRELGARRTILETMVDIAATLEERDRIESALRGSGAPLEFPSRARETWTSLSSRHREQEDRLEAIENEIAALVADLSSIPPSSPALSQAGQILLPLVASRNGIEKILRTLPSDRSRFTSVRHGIEALLAEHTTSLTLDSWLETGPSEASRKMLEAAWAKVEAQQQEHQRALADLSTTRKTLESLRPPGAVNETDRRLASLWDAESGAVTRDSIDLSKAESMVETCEYSFRKHRDKVALPGMPDLPALMTLGLPQERDIDRLAHEWTQAHEACLRHTEEFVALETELGKHEDATGKAPATPEQRDIFRQRRDLCWKALRARLLEESPNHQTENSLGIHAPSPLAGEFERNLAQADALADRLLERDHRDLRIADLRSAIAARRDRTPALEKRERDALQAWQTLWAPVGLLPGETPESGRDWYHARQAARQDWEALEMARERVSKAESRLDEFASRVARILGIDSVARDNAVTMARAAEEGIRSLDAAIKRHAHETGRLTELVLAEEQTVATVAEVLERSENAWQEACAESLPSLPPPSAPRAFLSALGEITLQVREYRRLEAELSSNERELVAVSEQIAPLLIGAGLGDVGASGLPRLLDLWSESQVQETRREGLESDLAGKRRFALEIRSQVDTLRRDLEALYQESASADEGEFTARLGLWESTTPDRTRLRSCRERIAARNPETLAEAATRSHAQWSQERDALLEEIEAFDRAMEERSRRIGGLRQEIAVLETGNEAALEARMTLSRRTRELNDQARSHLRNSLARIVLEKARESFSRSHTPRLQAWAGLDLSTMTRGRWSGIDLTDESLLRITDGASLTLDERALSTGTADQVRLAIRMAVARHWAETHEPLPFLLDDVLSHTDADRMPLAMAALQEVSTATQVIYFTCHDTVKDWGATHGAKVISVA